MQQRRLGSIPPTPNNDINNICKHAPPTGCRAVLPIHQKFLAKAGMPKQNGVPHLAAGDLRSEEISLATKVRQGEGSAWRVCTARQQRAWVQRAGAAKVEWRIGGERGTLACGRQGCSA